MSELPQIVEDAWENLEKPIIFSTVNQDKMPNSVYIGLFKNLGSGKILLADNYFSKTLENIQNDSKGSILFITNERKSYQLKGSIQYYTEGDIYNDMKKWLDPKYPGKGAAILVVEEIYCGAEKIL